MVLKLYTRVMLLAIPAWVSTLWVVPQMLSPANTMVNAIGAALLAISILYSLWAVSHLYSYAGKLSVKKEVHRGHGNENQ
ncbi:hypothetical protein FBPa29_0040 [Pseudomonas phage vB_PaeP_FBPa29]|uniref:Holin n=1 Tax=Pseudomonas phage vB_PaeP_FBPa39 TaxID=3231239 RepID=A0AAU8KVD3_9VIRU|nr:hypothetical protein FBPa29_0040 [Pseudomonas phage vB_PaeP_FBPa29]